MSRSNGLNRNRLLAALSAQDQALIAKGLTSVEVKAGDVLFHPGQDIQTVYFPTEGAIVSLVLDLKEGVTAEAAMIGLEGAVGGVISDGHKPAFTRGVVQIGGKALRLPVNVLERAQAKSPTLRDHFARYADCLLAQILQSVACNAVHEFDARLARWLLTTQDRVGQPTLRITHEFISEILGVQRTYTTRVVNALERGGSIKKARGVIEIINRPKLEKQSCECYSYLRRHFESVLPGVYPSTAAMKRKRTP